MNKLTCSDFGGPCEVEIPGDDFEEVARNCQAHVMEEVKGGDKAHEEATEEMADKGPEARKEMMAAFKKKYKKAQER